MVSNRDLQRDLVELGHHLEMIKTVLIVSNPDSPMAADAYNGLRRTVVQSLQSTQILHAAIAQLDSISTATHDIEVIRAKLGELMAQYGIQKIYDYEARPDAFERVGKGNTYTAKKPAYVTSSEMPPIQMGVAEATDGSISAPKPPSQPSGRTPDAVASEGIPQTAAETSAPGEPA